MNNIFSLSVEESELTNTLKHLIIEEINQAHAIQFSRFMELALYHPQYGYYNNLLHKFGKFGDFVTAPLVSNLFAVCLSKQVKELWQQIKHQNTVLEIGAGNGQLMLDMLKNIGDELDYYYILELSSSLTILQQDLLKTELPHMVDKVKWLNELPSNFDGVIIANEVLDAQPCELFCVKNDIYYLKNIGYDGSSFVYLDEKINETNTSTLVESIRQLPKINSNYTSEINMISRAFINSLADCLNTGCIILIDYGYGEDEYYNLKHSNGTLRGFFRQHLLNDVLNYTGLIDITSSVDFTAVAQTAISAGLDIIDYTSQANFLINCGIVEHINNVKNTSDYLKLTNQINRLTSPNEMGEIFKVIGLSKNLDFCDWLGFKNHSLTHLL